MNEYLAIDSGDCSYEQSLRLNCGASVCFPENSGLYLIDQVCRGVKYKELRLLLITGYCTFLEVTLYAQGIT